MQSLEGCQTMHDDMTYGRKPGKRRLGNKETGNCGTNSELSAGKVSEDVHGAARGMFVKEA